MTITRTTLWDAANGLAGILETAASNADYDLSTCVTPVEPAWDCGRIHVWPITIATQQIKCHAVPQVSLAYGVASCIGADAREDCNFWNAGDKTENALSLLWAVYAGLIVAYVAPPTGTTALCDALGGAPCNEVVINPVNTFESGDFVIYGGSVTFRLDIVQT